jgi:type II secretory pathway component PulF
VGGGIKMRLGDMYPAILTLVLIGIVLGVGLIVLNEFGDTAGVGGAASGAINSTRDAVDDFVVWIPVIVIIIAAAIILGLVMRSFRQ